ncbi:MAG: cytochrome c [Steroidobacteraceae bacterium]
MRRPLAPLALAAALAVWAVNPAVGYQPRVNFQLNCMGCHLADGSGEPGRVPSLRRSILLLSSLPSGRDYIIRVPGVAQSPLSNEETAALLTWMARNLSDLKPPPDFVEYSAAEIERARARPLTHVGETRARLLKAAAAIHPR